MITSTKFHVLIPLLLSLICVGLNPLQAQTVVFNTNLGDIKVELASAAAPVTVQNFMSYVNAAAGSNYDGTFFHRSINNFIVQGGGFYVPVDGLATPVPTQPPIVNEFGISNTRGTIAMAKLGGDPDSATNQWFFNTADNSANLDNQNGGFTVFGTVTSGMEVVDAIEALPAFDLDGPGSATFDNVPLTNNGSELVVINRISIIVLGDVNLDGTADFLDIAPFIALLSATDFQDEADCDCSGTVNFLDIAPFIAILAQR